MTIRSETTEAKKEKTTSSATRFLDDANARSEGIDEKWVASNEQWWDWYLSLAHEEGEEPGRLEMPPLPDVSPRPIEEIETELDAPYALSADAIEQFRTEGFVKLKEVCSPQTVILLRQKVQNLLDGSESASGVQFQSLEMLWTLDAPIARAFVLSRRLARLAAELLGVDAVRLYHDNALSKRPDCGRTPWHYDAHHYPIASENTVTLWMPLQPTPREMGPLAFARGMEEWERIADLEFSKFDDSYDKGIGKVLRAEETPIEDGPFELGELSFHHGRCLHTAGPNRTNLSRVVFSTIYFEDGARLVDSPTLISGDYEKFMPGTRPGERIESDLNPVLYSAESGTVGA